MQNAAIGPGNRKHDDIVSGYVAKIDWLTNLNRLGSTAPSIDYGRTMTPALSPIAENLWACLHIRTGMRSDSTATREIVYTEVKRPNILLYSLDIFVAGLIFTF